MTVVRRTIAVGAAAALVLTACGDDDGNGDGAAPATAISAPDPSDPGTTDPGTTDDVGSDSLEIAVRATIDEGSADYIVWGTNSALDEIDGDDVSTGSASDGDTNAVGGRIDFEQGVRTVTLEIADDSREVYLDGEALYVELFDDEAVGEDAEWGRVDVAQFEDRTAAASEAFGTAPDAYLALHDPAAVLDAVLRSQTDTTGPDDAGTADDGDGEMRRVSVNVSLDDVDDPFLQAALSGGVGTADRMTVYLWFEMTNDPKIRRMAYDLGVLIASGVGEPTIDSGSDGSAEGGTGTADDDTTGSVGDTGSPTGPDMADPAMTASGPLLIVDLDNLGDTNDIELPTGDDVRELELGQLDSAFMVYLFAVTGAPPGEAGEVTGEGDDGGLDGAGDGTGQGPDDIGNDTGD